MTQWFTGDNTFEIQQAVLAQIAAFSGTPERVDGTTLELKHVPDLLMGGTLFADKRLVIIKDLSLNTSVWEKMPEWLDRLSDDIELVLIDTKPDKRTTIYKEVKKRVVQHEFPPWGDRDQQLAESWLTRYAKSQKITLDKNLVHHIVKRVGLDQWQLVGALEKLSFLDTISADTINNTIEPNPSENVFQLFEYALDGRRDAVHDMIRTLELIEDPYKLFALLSSQAFQLAAVANAGPQDNPSKDFAIHPFVASKLSKHASSRGVRGTARILRSFAQTDADMKVSKADPWLLIERTLLEIAL